MTKQIVLAAVYIATFLLCFPAHSLAQEPIKEPKLEVQGKVGFYGGKVPGLKDHLVIGASAPYYFSFSSQFSVAPELLYLRASKDDQDFRLSALSSVDFRKPPVTVQPYGTSGVSFMTVKERGSPRRYRLGIAGIRFGVKIFLTDRFYIMPELGIMGYDEVMMTVSGGYVVSQRLPGY